MIVILCSVSDSRYNDNTVPGLIHFGLKSYINGREYVYAAYHPETNRMVLLKLNHDTGDIRQESTTCSSRQEGVSALVNGLREGDSLMVDRLSDLADTAVQAEDLYFAILKKGISMFFYDARYLNTQVLKMNPEPSEVEKILIQRIIGDYYTNLKENGSDLSKSELEEFNRQTNSKKKSDRESDQR
jgi:hypothetical protein